MWGCIGVRVSSYAEAEKKFNDTKPLRGTTTRPLGKRSAREKITIEKHGEDYALYCYNTAVVTYKPNGDVRLESGGWNTTTTAGAVSALSPFRCWCRGGELVVAGSIYYADGQRFIVPSEGLLFKPDEAGKLQPVNPPVAVQRKKRVRRAEARAARKFFKQVPVFIKAFSAAFEGGQKPQVGWPSLDLCDLSEPLAEEDAANIAWFFTPDDWDYAAGRKSIINVPDRAIALFWQQVYMQLSLIEDYEVPLPYGEVS